MLTQSLKQSTRRAHRAWRALATLLLAACALPAAAAIPSTEREVLISLYNSTGGDSWSNNTGWKTAGAFSASGTECTWNGVFCTGNNVTTLDLGVNNLTGTLPSTLNQLTALKRLFAHQNQLTGPIPSLSGMTALNNLTVYDNQLSGPIPDLSGTALASVLINQNQLTGPIPDLSGLNLAFFVAHSNKLTGPIPPLPNTLLTFQVGGNQLSGLVPAAPPNLAPNFSGLCPNDLTPSIDPAWDAATYGANPWYQSCRVTRAITLACTHASLVDAAGNESVCTVTSSALAPGGGMAIALTLPPASPRYTTDCPAVAVIPVGETTAPTCKIIATPNTTPGDSAVTATLALAPPAGDAIYTLGTPSSATVTINDDDAQVTAVPTLGEWSLMLLGLLAAGLGARRLRRQG